VATPRRPAGEHALLLHGVVGDRFDAILNAVGMNFHKLLRWAAGVLRQIFYRLLSYQRAATIVVCTEKLFFQDRLGKGGTIKRVVSIPMLSTLLQSRKGETMLKRIITVGSIVVIVGLTTSAWAAELIIGARVTPAIDPHFNYLSANIAYNRHMFDTLIGFDDVLKTEPRLATSWKVVDSTTLELKLRRGVKWHDGSEFTADDVVFSVNRITNVPNNPNSYAFGVEGIKEVKVIDPYTVQFKYSNLDSIYEFRNRMIFIVSKKAAEGATTADFVSGKACIGTGPYKFAEYRQGERLVLVRFDDYWGEKPYFDKVTFRIIPDDAARVAALLAGDVDMIDFPPPTQVKQLENKGMKVWKTVSDRVIYLVPDVSGGPTPHAIDKKTGKVLEKNPFNDQRVRQAISMAIDREAICDKVMEELAVPANQLVQEGGVGFIPGLETLKYDPEKAKKLLADAGYADGFGLTIHGPNDRFPNDAKVVQTIAQMLSRIGLKMQVETMPSNLYYKKVNPPNDSYSLHLYGWGNKGDILGFMSACLYTYDKSKSMGLYNGSRYSNPEFDRLVDKASIELDVNKRGQIQQEAAAVVVKDFGILPLYSLTTVVITKPELVYTPRRDEQTEAMNCRAVK
jgi:peptide/nickel transport system substrate-binding protein